MLTISIFHSGLTTSRSHVKGALLFIDCLVLFMCANSRAHSFYSLTRFHSFHSLQCMRVNFQYRYCPLFGICLLQTNLLAYFVLITVYIGGLCQCIKHGIAKNIRHDFFLGHFKYRRYFDCFRQDSSPHVQKD